LIRSFRTHLNFQWNIGSWNSCASDGLVINGYRMMTSLIDQWLSSESQPGNGNRSPCSMFAAIKVPGQPWPVWPNLSFKPNAKRITVSHTPILRLASA
jgi:hypothetical protein